ncbi:MAG: FAD-dependent oxidoreductase [Dehalococcoidia bacterium]|nr:FAD-dependent oxidoreductase [Dehalococcoidia bacterium]
MSGRAGADVLIVGGGVIGCAVGYFLAAEHGVRALVVERDGVARHASGGAAGELSVVGRSQLDATMTRDDPFTALCAEGARLHEELGPALREEGGIDYGLADTLILRPSLTQREAEEAQGQLAIQRALGLEAEWLEPSELEALGSWVTKDVYGAILTGEAQLESAPFAHALAQAAIRRGAEIVIDEVVGLEAEGGRAPSAVGRSGSYGGERVVLAAGPWSARLGASIGVRAPVRPVRGQILHLQAPAEPQRYGVFHRTGYALPKSGGVVYAGTTEEEAGFEAETTAEGRESILSAVARFAPDAARLPVINATACLRPVSDDGLPLMGAAPGWDSLYLATGHGRKGILLSLVSGKAMADLIVTGRSAIDVDAFDPARFALSRGG